MQPYASDLELTNPVLTEVVLMILIIWATL